MQKRSFMTPVNGIMTHQKTAKIKNDDNTFAAYRLNVDCCKSFITMQFFISYTFLHLCKISLDVISRRAARYFTVCSKLFKKYIQFGTQTDYATELLLSVKSCDDCQRWPSFLFRLNRRHLLTRSQAVARIADRTVKIVGPRDVGHAQFQGKLFVRPLGIPDTKLHTKFEVSSSRSFRDIALYAYWGHEFDLSRSRDVIGHVTIR